MTQTLLEALQFGEHSAKEMSVETGLSERAIRQEVMELRQQGYPIISGDFGYKLTNDFEEIKRCSARLISHGTSEIQIAKAMLNRALKLNSQLEMQI